MPCLKLPDGRIRSKTMLWVFIQAFMQQRTVKMVTVLHSFFRVFLSWTWMLVLY